MSYSCLEELQVDLDLHALDKTSVLSNVGCKYNDGWLVVTDDGICYLFDKDDNPDDIRKIKYLKEKHIRKDITKIVIPDSVRYIKDYTFMYNNKLMSVTIPNSVIDVGRGAFFSCHNLTNVTIGNCVKSIGKYAFFDCSSLMSMTIPNSVKSIRDYVFHSCKNLMSMTIPDSVTSIGYQAFYYCDKLANLIFKGKTLKQIKDMKDYPWGIEDESIVSIG